MFNEILETIAVVLSQKLGSIVRIGLPLAGESTTVAAGGGASVVSTLYDRKEVRDFDLTLYVKRKDQAEAQQVCDELGRYLTRMDRYPNGHYWRIKGIEAGGPIFVEQEESSKMWLYVNNIEVIYYS